MAAAPGKVLSEVYLCPVWSCLAAMLPDGIILAATLLGSPTSHATSMLQNATLLQAVFA